MAARRASPRARVVDLNEILPTLREALAREGVLAGPSLNRTGVPKAQHRDAVSLLVREGFEQTKAGARVPVRRQLQTILAQRKYVPVREIHRLLRGVPQQEAKKAVAAITKEGGAQLVLRGKIEVLTEPSAATFTRDRVLALQRACQLLAAQSAKVLKKPQMTLLVDDVRELLLDHVAAPRAHTASATSTGTLVDQVVDEVPRHTRSSILLSFVPDVVRALASHGIRDVQEALLNAARAGRIELRPESGLNRLSREELDLCPPGPQGTWLSWVRRLEGES